MSLAAGRPPYTPGELEKVAGMHVFGSAWGHFFATPEAGVVFGAAFASRSLDERCKMIEDGIIWVYELGEWAERVGPEGPRFRTFRWLDAASTKVLLKSIRSKVRLLPALQPWMDQTMLGVAYGWESEREIDRLVDDYERKRAAAAPAARVRFQNLCAGVFDPVKARLAVPLTYDRDEEGNPPRIALP